MSSHLQPFNRKSITAKKSFSNQNLFILLKHSQNAQIKSILSLFLSQIYNLVDQNNQTILHVAANNNNYEIIQYFIQEQKRLMDIEKDKDQAIKNRNIWMNKKNNDKFTCLHYAVFRNNYKLVTLLELNGADIYEVNSQGLSVLHIAAQANSPLLLYYFIHKGIPIQKEDKKGNTALHWSCYSSAQYSTYALIGWGADLNKKQHTFGMTPLHMSVIAGNSKIVKKLLIKGCQRNIQCSNGKYPIDMANENQYMYISQMIKDKRTCADIANFKTPFHKPAKISFQFYQFLFLFLSSYLLNIALQILTIIYQNTIHHQYTYIISILQIIFIVFCLLTLILFIALFASNPGKLTANDQNNKQLFYHLQRVPASNICFDCSIVKPERSKHCQICQSCISVYDHHCPWIGNCIGVDNFYLFYIFLLLLLFSLCSGLILAVYNIVVIGWMKEIYWYHILQLVVSIYTLVIIAIFIIPVIILLVRQTKNSLYNRTSYQYYTNKQNNPRMPTVTTSSSITQISDMIHNNKAEKHKKSQLSQALNSQFAESQTVQHNISFQIDRFSLKQKNNNNREKNNNLYDESNNKNIQLNQLIHTTKDTDCKVPQIRIIKQNYSHNCYMFCLGNRKIVKYRNAI